MNFAVRAAVLCALMMALSAPSPSPGLSALIRHMRDVNGGLYDAHIVSTSPDVTDPSASVIRTAVQGLRFKLEECTGKVCLGTYFDGRRLYSLNINDTALPRSQTAEAYLRALRILGTLAFLSPDFTAEGGAVYDGGMVTWNGKRVHKIFVSDKIATPMIVYVDPKTYLVYGAQDIDRDASYLMREYRRVGAFELPFEIDRDGVPLERYTSRVVAPGNLEPPHGISASASGTPAGMPLDPQSVTPLGTCTIEGLPVKCLIDSGNSAMSMSLELAERLGLQPVGMLHVAGLGAYATEVVRAGPLQMGNARFGDANYIVLSDIRRYGYDLVIGADVLASIPVTIDYAKHALYFGNQEPAPTGTTVPLQFENFVPVVSVALNDRESSLAIDTGDQSTINLGYDYYQRHPDLFHATRTENVSGVGGSSVELIGEIAKVQIGTLTAENQQIGTTKTLKGTADGHLGAGFLSQYKVVLDYAHERMRLLPATPM
jgi:hypothetical protein